MFQQVPAIRHRLQLHVHLAAPIASTLLAQGSLFQKALSGCGPFSQRVALAGPALDLTPRETAPADVDAVCQRGLLHVQASERNELAYILISD